MKNKLVGFSILFLILLLTFLYIKDKKETTSYVFKMNEIEQTIPFNVENSYDSTKDKNSKLVLDSYIYEVKGKDFSLYYGIAKNKKEAVKEFKKQTDPTLLANRLPSYEGVYGNVIYRISSTDLDVKHWFAFHKIKNQLKTIEKQK